MQSKYFTLALFVLFTALKFGTPVMAEDCINQYGQYGGNCAPIELSINKEVKNPITNIFVENLSQTDATFSPGNEVNFKVTVKNTSGQTFTNVRVRDVFPSYLTFVAGPGTYDGASNTLTVDLGSMTAGSSQTFELIAKVVEKIKLPSGQPISCFVNTVKANASERTGEKEDTAQICVTTEVLGATTLPTAGFNDLFLLIPFATFGLGGIALLRKKG